MSLSGALTTAVGGLNAQSRSLGSISDNIANSQTVGYKRVETAFATLLSVSNSRVHQPGGVIAKPLRTNDVQGAVQQTSVETNLAISGTGFFAVSKVAGVGASGLPLFEADPFYTRAGDFNVDADGFLVNTSGYYLNAWPIDPTTGAVNKNGLEQVRITQFRDNPQPTTNVTYSANLPSNPSGVFDTDITTPDIDFAPTSIQVFDSLGSPHNVNVQWTKIDGRADTFTATITDETGTVLNGGSPARLRFYVQDDPVAGVKAGALAGIDLTNAGGDPVAAGLVGSDVTVPLTLAFAGPEPSSLTFNLNFGKFGLSEQTTMFTGSDVEFRSARQNGLPPGSFRNLEIGQQGQLTLNYDNGARRTIYQLPLAQFSNYNGLKLESGNAYSATSDSGIPSLVYPGESGSGSLVASSLEGSNVDIAAEFTKMIQTQRAYGANTRVITVTSQLLEETNNIIR